MYAIKKYNRRNTTSDLFPIRTQVWCNRFETEQAAQEAADQYAVKHNIPSELLEVIDLDEYDLSPIEMTDQELVQHIANSEEWDHDALDELCARANLTEEYLEGCRRAQDGCAGEDGFEYVVEKAAMVLGFEL